jgi:hypothetical protein
MEQSATCHDAIDRDESSVHAWRALQLMRLGIPAGAGCLPRLEGTRRRLC